MLSMMCTFCWVERHTTLFRIGQSCAFPPFSFQNGMNWQLNAQNNGDFVLLVIFMFTQCTHATDLATCRGPRCGSCQGRADGRTCCASVKSLPSCQGSFHSKLKTINSNTPSTSSFLLDGVNRSGILGVHHCRRKKALSPQGKNSRHPTGISPG